MALFNLSTSDELWARFKIVCSLKREVMNTVLTQCVKNHIAEYEERYGIVYIHPTKAGEPGKYPTTED